jgi:L-fucose isomerase-like protein
MTTIMPVAQTTACLPLTLLNDNGFLAFCESDFVAIPAGVLLHHVSNRPVFLCNPSLPHKGVLTVSHCTAPRRMDGKNLEPVRVLTHYESDFGAATKVEMRKGQGLTIVDPDFAGRRWLGFGADILDTPFFPICRTQLDVRLRCDGQKLAEEIRGFHWLVAYGNHLRELGYAVRKAGINWLEVT